MCVNPRTVRFVRDDRPFLAEVSCKRCWQCRKARVDDYTGRCLAEAAYSTWSACVTLTYRDSPEREQDGAHRVILPAHFQKFVRALRDGHHLVRYLAVGEYGGKKGRAHFHALLFGRSAAPAWPQGHAYIDQWPHGFCEVDWMPSEAAMRYTVKYLLKAERGKYWFSLSKKPVLGFEFILKLAQRDHEVGALPSSFSYLPPGTFSRRRFVLTGAARREYLFERCRLAGLDPLPLVESGSDAAIASGEKLDRWLAAKLAQGDDPEIFWDRISAELDRRRPSAASVVRAQLAGSDERAFLERFSDGTGAT